MTTFRYCATDLVTGEVLADTLPLDVQSFSQQLNGGGTMTASLDLSEDYAANRPFLDALSGQRAFVWVLADDYPAWVGWMADKPDTTRAQGNLPLSLQTVDSLWSKRLIMATLSYPAVDIFTVFLDLLAYGTTLDSPYITSLSPVQGPPSALAAQQAAVAGLVLPQGAAAVAGAPWSANYLYSDHGSVGDAWQQLVQGGNMEYVFNPGLDANGNLRIFVQLGFNRLGRDYVETGYNVVFPANAIDYGKQETGSQGANAVIATAPPNGAPVPWQSRYPHGWDTGALEAGAPLLMTTASWQGSVVTGQAQIDAFADGQLSILSQGMVTPVVVLGGSGNPPIGDLVLGDTFQFAATSAIDPPQAAAGGSQPGWETLLRLTGWTVQPPGPQQSESITLQTSQILAAVNA